MNNTVYGIENIVTKLWDEYSVKEYRPIPFSGTKAGRKGKAKRNAAAIFLSGLGWFHYQEELNGRFF